MNCPPHDGRAPDGKAMYRKGGAIIEFALVALMLILMI